MVLTKVSILLVDVPIQFVLIRIWMLLQYKKIWLLLLEVLKQKPTVVQTNLKFQLIKQRVTKIKFLKVEQFNKIPFKVFLNLYADAAYTVDHIYRNKQNMSNTWLTGIGLGLDLVTYYDKVIRLEVSRNHLNEFGFYMHFKQPL